MNARSPIDALPTPERGVRDAAGAPGRHRAQFRDRDALRPSSRRQTPREHA